MLDDDCVNYSRMVCFIGSLLCFDVFWDSYCRMVCYLLSFKTNILVFYLYEIIL